MVLQSERFERGYNEVGAGYIYNKKKTNERFRRRKDIDFDDSNLINDIILPYIEKHQKEQVPRLQLLDRYYDGDNDIHNEPAMKENGAVNNRIASRYSRMVVDFETGFTLSKPVKYSTESKELEAAIEEQKRKNSEDYYNQLLKKDMGIYSRAYELVFVKEVYDDYVDIRYDRLDPLNTFIIYDYSLTPSSLCAVRYYNDDLVDDVVNVIELYTPEDTRVYELNGEVYDLVDVKLNVFGAVNINEYTNGDRAEGAAEAVIDQINAYDKIISATTSFIEQSPNPLLALTNVNVLKDLIVKLDDDTVDMAATERNVQRWTKSMREANVVAMDDTIVPNPSGDGTTVLQAKAEYLIPEYSVDSFDAIIKKLDTDILRFSGTPDFSDENFASNSSGVAMQYKLTLTSAKTSEIIASMAKGLARRMRLWAKAYLNFHGETIAGFDLVDVDNVRIVFTVGDPTETDKRINIITALDGKVSSTTMTELTSDLTNVPATVEQERLNL